VKKFKVAAIIMVVVLFVSFAGCSGNGGNNVESADRPDWGVPVRVAVLNGPTGIGAALLFTEEMAGYYDVSIYQSPDEIIGKVITGEVDVAAVPANLASILYNRTEGEVVNLGPIALGVLYIVQHIDDESEVISSISDLQGQTILAGGKGSTIEHILDKLLRSSGLVLDSDVEVEWFPSPSDVPASLLSRPGAVAMIPEPFVSIVKSRSENIRAVLDLNEEWRLATGSELTMSVLIAQRSFVQDRNDNVAALLLDFERSIYFVNNSPDAPALIAEKGFIPDAEIAAKAIPGCNLVFFQDRREGAALLRAFYEILYEIEPRSIGGSLPDENFYY